MSKKTVPKKRGSKVSIMLEEDFNSNYMSIKEVAAAFAVNPKTVARWIDAGKLHGIKTIGGHRRVLKSDVEKLLKKLEVA